MRIFESNPADHRRNETSIGERPIGNGIAGVVARYERASHKKQDRATGSCYGEAIYSVSF
jgi:hypothetical protein